MLEGKKILVGITGSIAAYKAVFLIRLLVTAGAEVKVILTPSAKDFVSPLTISVLSKNTVLIDLADESTWANHVMLGRWADVMIIAPLSCNSLSKMANGLCDNLVLAAYLSATCPIVVAPSMDEDMWKHSSTKTNIGKLKKAGNYVVSVGTGELASGLYGEGRMAEPSEIITFIEENIFRKDILKGKSALVSAGPTFEAIDPVRFIANHSSGKMGMAIAEELFMAGAEVHLVCGPVSKTVKYKGISVTNVISAEEMFNACTSIFPSANFAVMAAAVADYAPEKVSPVKIKKNENQFNLDLIKTKDILKSLGATKRSNQILVGFALETNDEEQNAIKKLNEKKADLMVLNSLNDESAGFGKDTNKVTIFNKDGHRYSYEAKSKKLVAADIVDIIIKKLNEKV